MLQGKGWEAAGAGSVFSVPGAAVPTVGTATEADGEAPAGPLAVVVLVPETVNLKVPSMGCESELTTRQTTVYSPAGAP
jgi:hypothetical protein